MNHLSGAALVPPAPNRSTEEVLGYRNSCIEQLGPDTVLRICPGWEVSWDDFVQYAPAGSVAIDGYVRAAPQLSPDLLHENLDHHIGVFRPATRSVASQALLAIKEGLFGALQRTGIPRLTIFADSFDQDVGFTCFLLKNHERFEGMKSEPAINRLLWVNDLLDSTGQAYPIDPAQPLMRQVAWVFEPYTEVRMRGDVHALSARQMMDVVHAMVERIEAVSQGKGREIECDTSYDELGGGDGWRLIRERGPYARMGLMKQGIRAYVLLVGEKDGIYHYRLGKMSRYENFPLEDICLALNDLESIAKNAPDSWGVSGSVGGSPKISGSKVPPWVVESIVNRILHAKGPVVQ